MFNIPNLDDLYEEVAAYVREHQGEKGYIDCQPYQEESRDTIYAIMYDDEEWRGVEYYVYGVRVVDFDIEVLLEPIMRSYRVTYAPEDFTSEDANEKWYSLRASDVYYIPTLFNIAECIEEYA